MATEPLVNVEHLSRHFAQGKGVLKAVDDVSFTVNRGETLGIVGESGCGKSTLSRILMRLLPPTEGRVLFDGHDLWALNASALRPLRRRFQMVFQDAQSSLNPRMTVQRIIEEPLRAYDVRKPERLKRVRELLDAVQLPSDSATRYPHEFSGGQRQRIGMARALALQPDLIIADEPVAALDVSVQAQILNLLMDLKKEFGLTYIFIAHDLSVVEYISDRVGVMCNGQWVECADSDRLYNAPQHPFTKKLIDAAFNVEASSGDPGSSSTGK